MPSYTKPPFNNIPFEFTKGGYSKPDFSNVPFRFGRPVYSQTADLQGIINAVGVGDTKDLGAYIKATAQDSKNLGGYVKSFVRDEKDLGARVNIFQQGYKNLGAVLTGELFKDTSNLPAYIYGIPPVDLPALIKGIASETEKDLPASIHGWDQKDLRGLLRPTVRDEANLSAYIYGRILGVSLSAYINVVQFRDLNVYLKVSQPGYKDLSAYTHSFSRTSRDLGVSLIGTWFDGTLDLQGILTVKPYSTNLPAYIAGFKGIKVPVNLPARVESYYRTDLPALISAISAVDLGATINATGKTFDLGATIIPKVIYLKRAINIALLEHRDLKAVINFACFGSEYRDLGGYVYPIYKHDLRAYIIGWYGGTADNVRDLGAYINTAIADVEDRITVRFVPEALKSTQLKIKFGVLDKYNVFDTLPIYYGSYHMVNLAASITGILHSYDLGATINPVYQFNYRNIPAWVLPKTHEVVINLERFEDQWRRFVEIMFDTQGEDAPFHYFYVSAENKVYRVDKTTHWIIWGKSYDEIDGSMVERANVRHKYIFRMSDYSTMDEAIRDLIDRVSTYRRVHLGATINGVLPPHSDLSASVVPKVKYSWIKRLGASIKGVPTGYLGTQTTDLTGSITGVP